MAQLNPDGTPMSLMQQAAAQAAMTNANPAGPVATTAPPVVPMAAPAIPAAPAAPAVPGAPPAPTTPYAFDESKSVAARVTDLTGQSSPLMQQAATQGAQLAAKRGLTNSSLAGQAEQQAVIAAATPIATADASLMNQAGIAGAQLGESSRQFGLTLDTNKEQFASNMAMQQQQLDTQKEQFAQQLGMTVQDLELRRDSLTQNQQQFLANLDQQKAALGQQLVIANLNGANQLAVAKLQGENQAAIQGNTNIANAWGTMMQNIQAIQNNANLEGPAKDTLIANNLAAFASYTQFWQKVNGGTINVDDLLAFGPASPAPTPGAPAPAPGTSYTPSPPGAAPGAGYTAPPGGTPYVDPFRDGVPGA